MIRIYPDPILRKPAQPVRPGSPEARDVAVALQEVFSQIEGLGLAANQIGFPLRAAIVRLGEDGDPQILLNPRIIWRSEEVVPEEEGCLSLPGVWAEVPRSQKVKVDAQDEEGNRLTLSLEGLDARLLQHEVDHLDGILYLDHLGLPEKRRVLREFRAAQLRKEERPSTPQVRA